MNGYNNSRGGFNPIPLILIIALNLLSFLWLS